MNISQKQLADWKDIALTLQKRGFVLSEPCLRLIEEHTKLTEAVAKLHRENRFLRIEIDKARAGK